MKMCLNDKKHRFSIRLGKNGFKVDIRPID
nr:MAG TPA: hypothetical protein [Caudoviricetes sp.]